MRALSTQHTDPHVVRPGDDGNYYYVTCITTGSPYELPTVVHVVPADESDYDPEQDDDGAVISLWPSDDE